MPPLYRPPPPTDDKLPPLVLPRAFAGMADLGDGAAWPKLLVIPPGAGMLLPCHHHGLHSSNEG